MKCPDDPARTATYDLPLPQDQPPAADAEARPPALPQALLIRNVVWFCQFRWIIIALLAAFGVVGLFGDLMERLALRPPGIWPFVTAGILALENLVFLAHARRMRPATDSRGTMMNLWGQIVLDLLVLTAVVHYVGSIETYVSFTYLLHIVLACIFLSRRQSLAVTLIAVVLYASCLSAERLGWVAPAGLFMPASPPQGGAMRPGPFAVDFLSAVAIWLVVWYLASHLSAMVLDRDRRLAQANRRLLAAQDERARHMLLTTHQLKAPFAAIHANAQLLMKGYCGELPAEATTVVGRIAARSRRLAREIQDMLQLANLSSTGQQPPAWVELDLSELLRWCLGQVEPRAQERHIAVEADLHAAPVAAVEDHLKMLFLNLLFNAMSYSHEGGRVRVRCRPAAGAAGATVVIADEGIGIAPEKLPRIFEEYYRTREALQHWKESSGLGLAIVRQVAELHDIHVRVASRLRAGTTVTLRFPPGPAAPDKRREVT
ncbi:MAG TPA: HAMP domain-containing sensor histidine kinase [Phycisphaerae bacterium]|nr:HAMP domain-containing sensor histidine kinase [Phycisphaerae bacterium]